MFFSIQLQIVSMILEKLISVKQSLKYSVQIANAVQVIKNKCCFILELRETCTPDRSSLLKVHVHDEVLRVELLLQPC